MSPRARTSPHLERDQWAPKVAAEVRSEHKPVVKAPWAAQPSGQVSSHVHALVLDKENLVEGVAVRVEHEPADALGHAVALRLRHQALGKAEARGTRRLGSLLNTNS